MYRRSSRINRAIRATPTTIRGYDAYDGGRLAPYWDAGTVHFHRQVADPIHGREFFTPHVH